MPDRHLTIPPSIERAILLVRGHRVLLDADLARLYGTSTRAVVQAVKRNRERFPPDFKFQLSAAEFADLRSQSVTSNGWGGRRTRPYAFTEQGVAMLSGVLRSQRAVQVNIEIMRAFVRLRKLLSARADSAHKVDELAARYDAQFKAVFDAIRQLTTPDPPPAAPARRIGFRKGRSKTR
jgi:hypothetical protein